MNNITTRRGATVLALALAVTMARADTPKVFGPEPPPKTATPAASPAPASGPVAVPVVTAPPQAAASPAPDAGRLFTSKKKKKHTVRQLDFVAEPLEPEYRRESRRAAQQRALDAAREAEARALLAEALAPEVVYAPPPAYAYPPPGYYPPPPYYYDRRPDYAAPFLGGLFIGALASRHHGHWGGGFHRGRWR